MPLLHTFFIHRTFIANDFRKRGGSEQNKRKQNTSRCNYKEEGRQNRRYYLRKRNTNYLEDTVAGIRRGQKRLKSTDDLKEEKVKKQRKRPGTGPAN